MSFPFIYPPYRIDGKHYFEGAAYQCLPLTKLVEDEGVDKIVLIDVMTLKLIRPPRNMWDAYAQSIIVPLVANARNEIAMFEYLIERESQRPHSAARPNSVGPVRLFRLQFDIPEQHRPQILDWSSSNLERMFEVGFDAGATFARDPENGSLFA